MHNMPKVSLAIASIGLAMLFTSVPHLSAQAPAAPLPSQILTAKKVFISNLGGGLDPKLWSGGTAQPYNELYAAIKNSGKYQLVAAPADADLILQISYANPLTDVGGTKESGANSSTTPQLTLVLLDMGFSLDSQVAFLVSGNEITLDKITPQPARPVLPGPRFQ